jgi:hypothetical protein
MMMRKLLLGLVALVAMGVTLVGDPRPSAARPWYPWCARFADRSGVEECLYTSFQQCQATISGIGGSCVENWYPRPVGPRRHGHHGWWPLYPD